MGNNLFIGIDLGGTKTRIGLVTDKGLFMASETIKTDLKKLAKMDLSWLDDGMELVWDDQVAGIGLGIAGMVDSEAGVFLGGPNLPDKMCGQNLAAILKKRYRRPVVVDNDSRCFAWGEYRFGAGRGSRRLIGITMGTGLGGGLILNGRPDRGYHGASGEIGHIVVDGNSRRKCPCGHRGHLEALASGPAMSAHYRELTGKKLSAAEISYLAKKGSRKARKAVSVTAEWLAHGLSSLIHAIDPEIIVIGGSLAKTPGLIVEARALAKAELAFSDLKSVKIVKSKLGSDANILGAAALGMETVGNPDKK